MLMRIYINSIRKYYEAIETWLLEEIRRRQIAVLWVAHDVGQIHRVADAHYRILGTSLERADGSD